MSAAPPDFTSPPALDSNTDQVNLTNLPLRVTRTFDTNAPEYAVITAERSGNLPRFALPLTSSSNTNGNLTNLPSRVTRTFDTNGSEYAAMAALRSGNPSRTNRPDFIADALSRSIADYERQLANTNLNPAVRGAYERMLVDRKEQLADHRTNFSLWQNVRLAEATKDEKQITQAKQELADYLAAKLGKIQGKTYPTGMDLDAVIREYDKASEKK